MKRLNSEKIVPCLTCVIGCLSMTALLRAEVPRLIHFQGKLLTMAGAQVAGTVDVQVRLYDDPSAPGPVLFDEMHDDVALTNALFSLLIGSQTPGGVPDSVLAAGELFLGITINGGNELAPRTQVVTSPYAGRSRAAEQLVPPDSTTPAVSVDAAGRVGVNTAAPDESAALDVSSTNGGLLPPRMTTAQRDALTNPALGLQIFNTTTSCLEFFVGGIWQNIACACSASPAAPGPIDGPAEVCGNDSSVVYSISPVFGADSYTWTVPPEATIVAGQQSPSITVDFGNASGNVIVSASNACGTSADRTLAVTVNSNAQGSQTFTTSGLFVVPLCIDTVRVLVVGGGAGGCGGHSGGGGSGHVRTGTFGVTPGTNVSVTVGAGGAGGSAGGINASAAGGGSSFGSFLSASGGPAVTGYPGGDGGSGGGGCGCGSGADYGGAGGSGGGNGQAGAYTAGGTGGNFDPINIFTGSAITAGSGGAGGTTTSSSQYQTGGGGGGGVRINGAGPTAADGDRPHGGAGGVGYGSGGGSGGWRSSGGHQAGGAGAPGVVYVEW